MKMSIAKTFRKFAENNNLILEVGDGRAAGRGLRPNAITCRQILVTDRVVPLQLGQLVGKKKGPLSVSPR